MANGHKTGGRKAGTLNKKTQTLIEKIEKHHKGYDPILKMIDIAENENTAIDIRVNILKEISSYIYPKRKAIEADIQTNEVKDPIQHRIDTPIEDLIKELKQNKPKQRSFNDLDII